MEILNLVLAAISTGGSIGYMILNILKFEKEINPWNNLFTSAILLIISLILLILSIVKKSEKKVLIIINPIILILVVLPLLFELNVIKLPNKKVIGNLSNMNIADAINWSKNNNIKLNYSSEYSDNFEYNTIISQDVDSSTLLNDVKEINVIVSMGPNYDKDVVIPNMIGWKSDKVLEYINANHLNNVTVNFVTSEYEKNTVIEQNVKGNAKRNSQIIITFSYGLNAPNEVILEDLSGKNKFELEIYLKMNSINYEFKYEFSDQVMRNYIISCNYNKGDVITSDKKLEIILSKGKSVKIPNLLSMNTDEINNFVINNNLKIIYDDKYDDKTELGKIISSSYNEGDVVEEGTTINIVLSKGQLKMEQFNSLSEFKDWANKYGIKYTENYQFNSSPNGSIINFSKSVGDVIGNNEVITVNISKGESVNIPSFVGMSKSAITSKCNNIGLTCKFSYSSYSSSAYDVALSQSKTGGEVAKGTVVTIYLSKGQAKSFTLYLQSNWFTGGSTSATISALSNNLSKQYPDVNFKYVIKPSNSGPSGGFHESSPTQTGTTVVQGKTYEIWIKQ